MTDEELQQFADQKVRVRLGGEALTGKLLAGFEAQLRVKAPYAIESHAMNPTLGTEEERIIAIPSADVVESIELVDPSDAADAETEAVAEDNQTPG